MKREVKIPEIGESITSGIVTAWLKENGDAVSEGDDIFELETDKATLAVPSPSSGILTIGVPVDTEVSVGQVVGIIDTEGAVPEKSDERGLSPAVRRIVDEYQLDVETIQGTGKGGRITKADALEAVQRKTGQKTKDESAAVEQPTVAAPATPTAPAANGSPEEESERVAGERVTRVKMPVIRKRIAERLVQAKQTTALLTTFNEIDMSEVMAIREQYKKVFEDRHGVRLGFMSFFIKACCQALSLFKPVNAQLDGDEIIYHNYYDIGVAVSTDRGLIVPVIRDADKKSFAQIETEIRSFVKRAGEKKLSVDELSGGTFSITNGGVFGSLLSTPIPNPPQTAILGMHAIQRRPVAVEDKIEIHPMMYVALSYDHRLIDGREAVSFLVKVKQLVEDPHEILLEL